MVVVILTGLLLAGLPQVSGSEGTVTGTLTLDGVPVAVAHVYASAQPGFFDKRTEDVRLLFSDVPLSDAERADVFALTALARADKARVLEVVIDQAGQPISGAIFARPFDGMASMAGMHKFARERMEHTAIAGRLSVDAPRTFMGVTFQYELRFAASIPRPPTAQERAAALASPAARAARAYLSALQRGPLAGFLATLTASAAAEFRGPNGLERLKQRRADMPPDSRVVNLVPQTDGSVLAEVEGHESGIIIGHSLRLVPDAGTWKVAK